MRLLALPLILLYRLKMGSPEHGAKSSGGCETIWVVFDEMVTQKSIQCETVDYRGAKTSVV